MDDAELVLPFHLGHELVRIDHDLHPSVIPVVGQLEQQDTRLRRDRHPHGWVELQAGRAVDLLVVQKDRHELAQALALGCVEAGEEAVTGEGLAP